MRKALSVLLVLAGSCAVVTAQTRAVISKPGTPAPRVVEATLAQLMKGILFPNSNVVFFAQSQNPADVPPAKDPSTATDPLADTYGKWEAVENSALALAESARLLTIRGASVRTACLFRLVRRIGPSWFKG